MHDSSLWRALIGVKNTVIEGVEYDAGARTLVVAARPAAQRRCGFCRARSPGDHHLGEAPEVWHNDVPTVIAGECPHVHGACG